MAWATVFVPGSMRDTALSPALATHTARASVGIATGSAPARSRTSVRPVFWSIFRMTWCWESTAQTDP
jgi:hypothetical protein